MRVNGIQRTWLVAAAAVMLVPCMALAQVKSPEPSSCQAGFERFRAIRASLSSPEIYPRIAAELAIYERELLVQLDKDWAGKAAAGKRPSESPNLLRDAAQARDEVANVHRTKTDERYKDSARFFIARNELDVCLLRARLARIESAAQPADAGRAKDPAPSGPLDQAALNRLSWDELTGVYQRVISAPKPDLEYARRIVRTALRRFPDHKNAPGARSVLAQIEKQLAPLQAEISPPAASPVPTPLPAPRRNEERPASPQPADDSRQFDQAQLDRMGIEELIAVMDRLGPEFRRAVDGKMSNDGRLRRDKLSAGERRSLVTVVPAMKMVLRTMLARFPQHQAAAEAPAYIAFFTGIERDLGLGSGVTLASRPDQATLDRLPPDELAALFFEFGAKNDPDEKSRQEDLRIVRMVLQTAVLRHPKHPFAAQARKVLAVDDEEEKRRAAISALPSPALSPTSPVPAAPALGASPAPAPVVHEPSVVERIWQTILSWLGLEASPAGS